MTAFTSRSLMPVLALLPLAAFAEAPTMLRAQAAAAADVSDGKGRRIEVGPDGLVSGTLNGHPVRMRVLAQSTALPIVDPAVAQASDFKPSIFRPRAQIGATSLKGWTTVARLAVAGLPEQKARVIWFPAPYADGAQVVLGPELLDASAVTFRLRPTTRDRAYSLPLVRVRGRLGTQLAVNGQTIFVQWDVSTDDNLATAAAASDLAAAGQGTFDGAVAQRPIGFGIARPVRTVRLRNAQQVGPVRFDAFLARTTDYGTTGAIPDEAADASEIVVVGKGKRQAPFRALTLGRASLSHCASITYDIAASRIVLMCEQPA